MERANPYVVYFDTSAILKLYVEERWSDVAERAAGDAEDVLASEISYLEARASFARLREDGEIASDGDLRRVVQKLDEDWTEFEVSPVDWERLRAAGGLAERHRGRRLRSYDALHLTTAVAAARELERSDFAIKDGGEALFLAFDRRLVAAARAEPGPFGLYFDPFAGPGDEGGDGEAEDERGTT